MRKLRFKYDNIHKFVVEKDHELEMIKVSLYFQMVDLPVIEYRKEWRR